MKSSSSSSIDAELLPFDDEQLFYLMSRGIAEADARRLVVRGFFAELIEQIGVPQVQEHLMNAIEKELERAALGA